MCVLAGLILWLNFGRRDWFGPGSIQISYRVLPEAMPGAAAPVVFMFDREWSLNSIRVIAATNSGVTGAPTLWDLVSTNGSANMTHVHYGAVPNGMVPRYPGDVPKPLVAGTTYRIEMESGKRRGGREFVFQPVKPRR